MEHAITSIPEELETIMEEGIEQQQEAEVGEGQTGRDSSGHGKTAELTNSHQMWLPQGSLRVTQHSQIEGKRNSGAEELS